MQTASECFTEMLLSFVRHFWNSETSFLMPNNGNTTTRTPTGPELFSPLRLFLRFVSPISPLRKLVFAAFLPLLNWRLPRLCRHRRLYSCYVHPIAAAALNCNLEIQDDRNRILAAISHHTQTGKGRKAGRKRRRRRRRQSARCALRK